MFIEKVRMPAKGAFSLENTEKLRVHLYVILTRSDKGKIAMEHKYLCFLSYPIKL